MSKGDQLGNLIFRGLKKWSDRINGGEFKLHFIIPREEIAKNG